MAFKEHFTSFCELDVNDLYILRQVNPEKDLDAYSEIYADPDVFKYYEGGTTTSDRERVSLILKNQCKEFEKTRVYTWVIAGKQSDKALGRIHLSEFACNNRTANIGYFLHKDSWGKGIVSACIKPVAAFGFSKLGLERIYTTVHTDNTASWKALEKNGFTREGLLRHSMNLKSGLSDCYMYAKLSTDESNLL